MDPLKYWIFWLRSPPCSLVCWQFRAGFGFADSCEHGRRNVFIHLIHRELDKGLESGEGLRSL